MTTPPRDPYLLDARFVAEPPESWLARLRLLGPGLILTASIVGSGELIATTTLGAKAGFSALWIVLLSCLVKVSLQLEFGRHTIQTGETALTAFNRLPGPAPRGVNWTIWFWLLIQPVKVLQVGGIIGAISMLLHEVVPSVSVTWWCWITAATTALLVGGERYGFIERACIAMVAAFTATTLVAVVALQWTSYAVSGDQLAEGFRLELPAGGLLIALGAFGLTGVGGDEIMQYTYWLIEKGYAAKTGPRDDADPQWERRARQWINVMYLDAFASMLVYTVVTAGFYILGAAVLHSRGEVPGDAQIVPTLSNMYTESLGPWAREVFLLGSFVVLYSTLYSALASWTRTFSDAAGKLGLIDFDDHAVRRRSIALLAWTIPLVWAGAYLLHGRPVNMVILGGVATSAILLVVIFAAIDFRYRRSLPELAPGRFYDLSLWVSIAAIAVLAIYTAVTAFQTGFGG